MLFHSVRYLLASAIAFDELFEVPHRDKPSATYLPARQLFPGDQVRYRPRRQTQPSPGFHHPHRQDRFSLLHVGASLFLPLLE
jgi:hypothetical protein